MYPTYGQVPNVYKMNVLKENFLLDFVRTLVEFFSENLGKTDL